MRSAQNYNQRRTDGASVVPPLLALLALILATLWGCASGGGGADPLPVKASDPPASTPPASTPPTPPPDPAPPPPTVCPPGTTGTPPACITPPPPTLPACPVGTDPAPLACTCPPAYLNANDGSCIVPPGGGGGGSAPPTMSLSAAPNPVQPGGSSVLTWNSSGAIACYGANLTGVPTWPGTDQVAPSGAISTPALTVSTPYTLVCSGPGGNAEASIIVTLATGGPFPDPTCTPPAVLIGNTCQNPPTLSAMALVITPESVADSSQGCPPPDAAQTCAATITGWPPISTLAGDAFVCLDQDSSALNTAIGWSTAPYPAAQDGPHVYTVTCYDGFGASTSASITLNVVPPLANPLTDTFTGALNSGIFTATWQTYSAQGAGGCSVRQSNSQGLLVTLNPGGTPGGSASSGFLSPSGDPYTFELICSGAVDAGVPAITVSP